MINDTFIIIDIFRSIKYNSLVFIINNKNIIKANTSINIFDMKIFSNRISHNLEFIKVDDNKIYENGYKSLRDSLYDGFHMEIGFIRDFPIIYDTIDIDLGNGDIITKAIESLDTRFIDKKCLSTIQKGETHLIESWINYHRTLGFECFIIYDNGFNIDNYKYLLDKYRDCLYVIKANWQFFYSNYGGVYRVGQAIQQNHSIWKYSPQFIGLIDLDEYIQVNGSINLFNSNNSVLSLPNYWFGCNNKVKYNNLDFIRKLTKRTNIQQPVSQRKCIYQSKNVDLVCVHNAINFIGEYTRLTYDEGYLRHYRVLSEQKRACDCRLYCQIDDPIN
jgi:hypothetical protein